MDLPRRASGCPFIGAGEEAEPRSWLSGLGQGGAAARPLDGGVLTRWGARAPARGPATAPWPLHRRRSRRLALGQLMVVLPLRRDEVERGESGEEERESNKTNETRVRKDAAVGGFLFIRNERSAVRSDPIRSNGARCTGRLAAQAGARDSALCWPRPRLRPGCGLRARAVMGRPGFAGFWAETVKNEPNFRFFPFSRKLKIEIGSKENRKSIFPCG